MSDMLDDPRTLKSYGYHLIDQAYLSNDGSLHLDPADYFSRLSIIPRAVGEEGSALGTKMLLLDVWGVPAEPEQGGESYIISLVTHRTGVGFVATIRTSSGNGRHKTGQLSSHTTFSLHINPPTPLEMLALAHAREKCQR